MPSDANGAYSLPSGYLAVTGETIQASQHNPPLEDLASAMTARLPKSGVAPMTGPLQLTEGTSTAPALTFASATNIGFYKVPRGFNSVGFVSAVPVGTIVDFAGTTAPSGWQLCYAQSLLRSDFAELFSIIGTTYGSVDSLHFTLPDCRGRVLFGKDGGAGRLSATISGDVLGATGGAERQTVAQANLPDLTWPQSLSVSAISDGRTWTGAGFGFNIGTATDVISAITGTGYRIGLATNTVNVSGSLTGGALSGSVTSGGSGTPIATLPPAIILNKIIFCGV